MMSTNDNTAKWRKCDQCETQQPNVGKWEDGRQLCGPCKMAICLARPGFVRHIEESIALVITEDSKEHA